MWCQQGISRAPPAAEQQLRNAPRQPPRPAPPRPTRTWSSGSPAPRAPQSRPAPRQSAPGSAPPSPAPLPGSGAIGEGAKAPGGLPAAGASALVPQSQLTQRPAGASGRKHCLYSRCALRHVAAFPGSAQLDACPSAPPCRTVRNACAILHPCSHLPTTAHQLSGTSGQYEYSHAGGKL